MVGDTGIEPVTSSVSGKRSPAELIARDPLWGPRWERDSNPCTRLCRPLPRLSAIPPSGPTEGAGLPFRADDGIRTRDPHLGKVMRYQLRYVRTCPRREGPALRLHCIRRPRRLQTNDRVPLAPAGTRGTPNYPLPSGVTEHPRGLELASAFGAIGAGDWAVSMGSMIPRHGREFTVDVAIPVFGANRDHRQHLRHEPDQRAGLGDDPCRAVRRRQVDQHPIAGGEDLDVADAGGPGQSRQSTGRGRKPILPGYFRRSRSSSSGRTGRGSCNAIARGPADRRGPRQAPSRSRLSPDGVGCPRAPSSSNLP